MLLQDYVTELNKAIEEESAAIARGGAASFEAYKERVGFIKGLTRAHDLLLEVYKSTPKEER